MDQFSVGVDNLAIDVWTHAIAAAEVGLETVGGNEVLPTLLNRLRRKIEQVSADDAYDSKECQGNDPTEEEYGIVGDRTSP